MTDINVFGYFIVRFQRFSSNHGYKAQVLHYYKLHFMSLPYCTTVYKTNTVFTDSVLMHVF